MVNIIEKIVCDNYNITPELLYTKSRKRAICFPRQIIMYLLMLNNYTSISAGAVYDRDHATALHAKKTVLGLMDTDKNIKNRLQIIIDQISNEKINEIVVQDVNLLELTISYSKSLIFI